MRQCLYQFMIEEIQNKIQQVLSFSTNNIDELEKFVNDNGYILNISSSEGQCILGYPSTIG